MRPTLRFCVVNEAHGVEADVDVECVKILGEVSLSFEIGHEKATQFVHDRFQLDAWAVDFIDHRRIGVHQAAGIVNRGGFGRSAEVGVIDPIEGQILQHGEGVVDGSGIEIDRRTRRRDEFKREPGESGAIADARGVTGKEYAVLFAEDGEVVLGVAGESKNRSVRLPMDRVSS